ncbi:MAG TPA: hypothetical protein VGE62_04085 [Candidatus Paceibacterota bacterium]
MSAVIRLISAIELIGEALFPKRHAGKFNKPHRGPNAQPQRTETSIRIGLVRHENAKTLECLMQMNKRRLSAPFEDAPPALFAYRNDFMKAFLWQIKYYAHEEFIKHAADIWSDELIAILTEKHDSSLEKQKALIIHPPSSGYALGTKAFDQMSLLAEKMITATALGNFCEYARHAVEHSKRDDGMIPQHKGSRRERLDWAARKFRLSEAFVQNLDRAGTAVGCENVHIICIDDVTTTGATLSAIRQLIQDELRPVRLILSAFAH